ncbi:hypothetical protein HLB23_08440 [Nocardia uniformis]|uniref:Uncharacterized protein n=1 Tax=Nocardia uniformis TaxID=53432 RepID=A0A849C066_9NOCA|nr:hypothetical protein [Nocardia uniformis]NNH69890.1 hypothetical protein [Nocardia uniformis]
MRKVIAALAVTATFALPAGIAGAAPVVSVAAPVAAPSGSALDTGSADSVVNAFCALIHMLKIGSVDSSGGPKCGTLSS